MFKWWVEKILRNHHKQILPGRWMPKENVEKWMLNNHPEPGYMNKQRKKWIEKNKVN